MINPIISFYPTNFFQIVSAFKSEMIVPKHIVAEIFNVSQNINVKWKYGNSSNLKIYYKGLTMPPLQPLKESFCPVNKIN